MRPLLDGLGRILGTQLALRAGRDLDAGPRRAVLLLLVLGANLAPVLAVLTGTIGYGDVWLWLALEVITIYLWTELRLVLRWLQDRSRVFAAGFFGFHFGMFALLPFALGLLFVLAWSPLRAPWLTVVVLGGFGFLAYGWSVRGLVRDRAPVGVWGFLQAYARMFLAYAALFAPMIATGQNEVSDSRPLAPVSEGAELAVSLGVLGAKLVLELVLVVAVEQRADGSTSVFGRPLVVTFRRST